MADLVEVLLERAGLDSSMISLGKDDPEFVQICEALQLIHRGKEVLYGNYMETHADDPELFSLMQHYMDLKRKYVRAENFIKKMADGEVIPLEELLDTYADMAVYSIMGIQVVNKFIKLKNQTATLQKREKENLE